MYEQLIVLFCIYLIYLSIHIWSDFFRKKKINTELKCVSCKRILDNSLNCENCSDKYDDFIDPSYEYEDPDGLSDNWEDEDCTYY